MRFIFNGYYELIKFFNCPKLNFLILFFPHVSNSSCRILWKIIESTGMIEYSTQLIVYSFEIGHAVASAFIISLI